MQAWRRRALGVLAVFALALAACAGDDTKDATSAPAGEPTDGGSLTVGLYMPTSSLDPVVNPGFGVSGGIELLAVYDSIMRWDPETGDYEPRMAESLEPNDDHSTWTLTLREGITFTDGNPFNAEAVKFSLDRHRVGGEGAPDCQETRSCPSISVASLTYVANITEVEVINDLTAEIRLDGPWPSFPLALAGEPGMVPSPEAVKAACEPDEPVVDCSYGMEPVGAGPFEIASFKPGEEVRLVSNDDYWGGDVHLDELRFTSFGDAGGDRTAEALISGGVDVAFLREPSAVATARDAGFDGYTAVMQAGRMSWLNNGRTVECEDGQPASCAGQPDGTYTPPTATETLEVRQAIAAAIDREQLFERVYDGHGLPGAELFQDSHRLYPGVPGPDYDLDRAKQLVEEAKDAGWDGTVRLACPTAEADRGLALATMLEAAGMDVDLDTQLDTAGMIDLVNIRGEFDIACTGVPLSGDDLGLLNSIEANFDSTSRRNRTGYSNPQMDEAVERLHLAVNDDEKQAALTEISEIFAEDVPWLVEGAVEELVAWSDDVHGIYPTQSSEVFFDEAWVDG